MLLHATVALLLSVHCPVLLFCSISFPGLIQNEWINISLVDFCFVLMWILLAAISILFEISWLHSYLDFLSWHEYNTIILVS